MIGVPPVAVPTAEIYRYLERRHWSGPGPIRSAPSLEVATIGPDLLVNDLETVALARYPQIGKIKGFFNSLGRAGLRCQAAAERFLPFSGRRRSVADRAVGDRKDARGPVLCGWRWLRMAQPVALMVGLLLKFVKRRN